VLDGEDDAVVDADRLLVGDVDSIVEVGVPNWVLTTFPFPSKMMPRSSMQQPGSLSQQKLRHCPHQPWAGILCR
jgi:hypothetical protein